MPQPRNIRPAGSGKKHSSSDDKDEDYDPMLDCPNNDPYSFRVNRRQVNRGRERDYENHNFGLWKDVEEYHGEETGYDGSCELEPEDALENASQAVEMLEE